ncbi:DUF4159 domain-containing protein [Fluviicola sp.]|jgi:hypothetical protein|uniref:DUF4159 domain-containing protein n=1 Tax=Fluviicola sp. TaxID=1917219 RepID=UPI002829ACB0|nr:DUF4159 domain-containing protein [Fluviicola sp.]MDR0802869.1 DUF4159 domain-containing protein [Fluviicola sp.]
MKPIVFVFIFLASLTSIAQGSYQIAFLKYSGGGDYYANPTALPNLVQFCNSNLGTTISKETPYVDVGSPELSLYPFIHMTGHGNVVFSLTEAENLRNYLLGGGFLHIDDNYGMDKFIRGELKKVFPNNALVELPFSHPVFHQKYDFNGGLPKIHEHDGKRPQAFGIIVEGRLVCLYTFETDLSDGWEDQAVHNDPEEKRKQALQMGANILMYTFLGGTK